MKICILGTAYPYKGGIASFNERLAQELIKMGHSVSIVTFTLQYPSIFFPGKSQYSNAEPPSDLSIRRGINSVNPLTWIREGRKLKKEKYDLIIAKFWLPVIGPALGTITRLGRNKNTRAISIIDNIIPHEKRPGDKLFTRFFTNSVDGFVTMSHKVESQMGAFVKEQEVIYAPHPIYDNYGDIIEKEEACKAIGLDPGKPYLLFFGYIRAYKGLDLLLRSFAEACKKNKDIHLLVAGEYYSDKEQYLNLIEELDLKERVILRTDFIENDQVKYYFCASDIVAQTYKSATQSGISQLAIHFEKPILSTNVGGLPETTKHLETGYVVNVKQEDITDCILQFFEDSQNTKFVGGIQKLKQLFSWQNFTTSIIQLRNRL